MHHLVVAAQLRVLVEQRVEAVRALRDDLLHAHAVERLDVLRRQHLEDVLVALSGGRTPVRISAGPRMAKSMPARCMSLAIDCVTFWFLSSKLPAQPTQ